MSEVEVAYIGLWSAVIGASIGTGGSLGLNYLLEKRKTRKAIQLGLIKEKLEKAYSPLYFHFEHMKAWGERIKKEQEKTNDKIYFAFSQDEIKRIMEDIYQILRANMDLISPKLANLILQLQVYLYQDEAQFIAEQAYKQLKDDYESLVQQRNKQVGE